MKRRSSVPIIGALVVSVLGAGVTRSLVVGQRQRLEAARGTAALQGTNLSNLNSFALGLLLGGLRGPLVMALWTSSENQKTEKNLEDFDTKVELIRLLQPEFDTVHLFQVWNKAYNVSVQMANVPNKYTTILDALAYAASVDRERPNNINMLAAIAGLYFDKFGGSAEKGYFSTRLQAETLPVQDHVRVNFPASMRARVLREARLSGATNFMMSAFEADGSGERLYLSLPKVVGDALRSRLTDPAVQYTVRTATPVDGRTPAAHPNQHRSLLDDRYDVLPTFLEPRAGHSKTGDAADGSELPYMTATQPYPYGVSPYALAYDYYKRCQWLQLPPRNMRHAQLADRVLSSRVPMALEKWAEEDWYAADRGEIDLAGRTVPAEESELQFVTSDLVATADLPKCPLLDQTIWRFDNASKTARRAIAEYESHLTVYHDDELAYRSHIRDLEARSYLTAADGLYLQVIRAAPADRPALAAKASENYVQAANLYSRYLMKYFMDDTEGKQVLPQDYRRLQRLNVDVPDENGNYQLRDDELPAAIGRMRAMHAKANLQLSNSTDFVEIYTYIERGYARLRSLSLVR